MTGVRAERSETGPGSLRLAVIVPLAFAGVAWGLFLLTDVVASIGPLDWAAFGWGVVIPLWLAGAPATALAWRPLTYAQRRIAATAVWLLVGGVAAYLFWRSVALPACEPPSIREPVDWLIPSIIVGAVIGAGPVVGGLAGSYIEDARPWKVILGGAVVGIAINVTAFAVLVTYLSTPTCLRERPQVDQGDHIASDAASVSAAANATG